MTFSIKKHFGHATTPADVFLFRKRSTFRKQNKVLFFKKKRTKEKAVEHFRFELDQKKSGCAESSED